MTLITKAKAIITTLTPTQGAAVAATFILTSTGAALLTWYFVWHNRRRRQPDPSGSAWLDDTPVQP